MGENTMHPVILANSITILAALVDNTEPQATSLFDAADVRASELAPPAASNPMLCSANSICAVLCADRERPLRCVSDSVEGIDASIPTQASALLYRRRLIQLRHPTLASFAPLHSLGELYGRSHCTTARTSPIRKTITRPSVSQIDKPWGQRTVQQ